MLSKKSQHADEVAGGSFSTIYRNKSTSLKLMLRALLLRYEYQRECSTKCQFDLMLNGTGPLVILRPVADL